MVIKSPLAYSEWLCCWFAQLRLSRLLILSAIALFIAPLIIHYYLSSVETSQIHHQHDSTYRSRLSLDVNEDYTSLKASELRSRIEELHRIKNSVLVELRDLEQKRQKLQTDISGYTQRINGLKQEHLRQQTDLDRLKISVEQAQLSYKEAVQRNTLELAPPKELRVNSIPEHYPPLTANESQSCRMFSCFDYSRCPLSSGFPVYFYDTDSFPIVKNHLEIDGFLKTTLKQALGYNAHITNNPNEACVFLVLVGEALTVDNHISNKIVNETALYNLPYWGGDGRNHVLINLSRRDLRIGTGDAFGLVNIGRAILIQSTFKRVNFRDGFDLIVPPFIGPPGGDVWQESPFMLPARRKYLMSFQGETKPIITERNVDDSKINSFIVEHLMKMEKNGHMDVFYFQFQCIPASEEKGFARVEDWAICGTDSLRRTVLKDSTFALILVPGSALITSTLLQARVYESLRSGAIPVILGGNQILLAYDEVIDWNKAAIFLPKARITELYFILRSVSDADILQMRRQGRFIWENYLSSVQSNVDVIIAVLRTRVGIPAKPIEDVRAVSVFNSTFTPLTTPVVSQDTEPDESLGPIEPPYKSPAFKRNYTIAAMQGYEIWNVWGDPFKLYPQLPFDTVLPSDAKFRGSETGFRPIGKGAGGAGKEFCEALGGNHPREQFTIVILTYEREQVLLNSIARLRGLPYLNKVVVVWNSPRPPAEDLRWPEIGVPVEVVKAPRNSLNNRFLPLDTIETEAVLSVDDDAHLRHDEIIFGFRVWREHRDRVVGFPGRFHAWDVNYQNSWLYNSNYSCEFSMVLTGAAFVHKYFLYLYWYWLPQAVRDKVDEYMNCEDVAMNFLVSHVTRKPPVKVTSRWTFRCPGCPVSLSEDETHFNERHKCINFFAQIFGYTPLLMTQYRADSILFKTRIPHDKQKCFKFI